MESNLAQFWLAGLLNRLRGRAGGEKSGQMGGRISLCFLAPSYFNRILLKLFFIKPKFLFEVSLFLLKFFFMKVFHESYPLKSFLLLKYFLQRNFLILPITFLPGKFIYKIFHIGATTIQRKYLIISTMD